MRRNLALTAIMSLGIIGLALLGPETAHALALAA